MWLQQLRFFGVCHTPANFCGIFLDCKSTYFLKFYFFSICCCMFCISAFLCYWVSWRCCCCVLQLIVCTCGPRDIFCNLFFTLLMGSGLMWLCVCMCVCLLYVAVVGAGCCCYRQFSSHMQVIYYQMSWDKQAYIHMYIHIFVYIWTTCINIDTYIYTCMCGFVFVFAVAS